MGSRIAIRSFQRVVRKTGKQSNGAESKRRVYSRVQGRKPSLLRCHVVLHPDYEEEPACDEAVVFAPDKGNSACKHLDQEERKGDVHRKDGRWYICSMNSDRSPGLHHIDKSL